MHKGHLNKHVWSTWRYFWSINLKSGTNILRRLHRHHSGFHILIFWWKNCSVTQSLISKGTKFQFLGPRYDNISIPYNTVFTLYDWKLASWRRLCGTLASLNNSHIIFGATRCLSLYILRASFWCFNGGL